VTESSHAVFLSYASQDAEAAHRIAEALRAGRIEVWLDQSELRGGETWDRKIRKEIHDCALFIPLISQHSQERLEGYFRLEWKLAADRSYRMAAERPFIVPIVVDSTRERDALVPDVFRDLQWTHLPDGETTSVFVDRVRRLLSSQQPDTPAETHVPADPTTAGVPTADDRTFAVRRRAILLAIAAAAVAGLGYLALERVVRSKPPVQEVAAKSIAVLPLTNESGDASQQYFSDGLSEDLITALSHLPGLRVIGRTSSFQFRDSKDDSKTIGAKLGVAHLLEGSVRRAGDVVRVSAELIDTFDGSTQWSERYDRPYKDLFALQDEITHSVAGALKAHLLLPGNALTQSDRPPSGNLEAYNALLQGRFYATTDTEANYRKAIELYTTATQLDPRYGLAWSELAWAWTGLGSGWMSGASAQQAFAKARAAADTALALSPDLADAHLGRAWLRLADFDVRGAQVEARRALELRPDYGRAKLYLADELASSGQLNQAVELARQALMTDPLHANWYNLLSEYLLGLNRLDEAGAAVRKAIALQPKAEWYRVTLVRVAIQRGDAQAAMAAAQEEPSELSRDFALALAQQVSGDRGRADAALKHVIDKHAKEQAYGIAQIYALRRDPDKMFEWLEHARSNRDYGILMLLYDPLILRYKDDPRLSAFCREIGLPTLSEVEKRT
jgi:TolB-like protein/Tfp pilus assembly protein PilF